MKDFEVITNPAVEAIFINYPDHVRIKMLSLRSFIIEIAKEIDDITCIEETLKWGEPSFTTKIGSTLRIDWKPKNPKVYAVYFQCSSRLIETFKIIFKNSFKFEGKRAILLAIDDKFPKEELKLCIIAALRYHKVKKLPSLGI